MKILWILLLFNDTESFVACESLKWFQKFHVQCLLTHVRESISALWRRNSTSRSDNWASRLWISDNKFCRACSLRCNCAQISVLSSFMTVSCLFFGWEKSFVKILDAFEMKKFSVICGMTTCCNFFQICKILANCKNTHCAYRLISSLAAMTKVSFAANWSSKSCTRCPDDSALFSHSVTAISMPKICKWKTKLIKKCCNCFEIQKCASFELVEKDWMQSKLKKKKIQSTRGM